MPETRPRNPRVSQPVFADFTPTDSPLIWEDYLEDPELADLRTTELSTGDEAPDFELPLVDLRGDRPTLEGTFHLDTARCRRPQALVFGSFTCPPFRNQVPDAAALGERFAGLIDATLVYVHEAHAEDGWVVTGNREAGVRETTPTTLDERAILAAKLARWSAVSVPIVLDDLEDTVCRAYGGMPNRLTLVDRDRRVAHISGEGPMGFDPDELAAAVEALR